MRAGARMALAGVGILAVCLVTLWGSVAAGCWLALRSAPTASQVGAAIGLVVVMAILARAVALLVADLRDPRFDTDACECCEGPGFGEGAHQHGPLCEHPCCPDGDLAGARTCQVCGCTDAYACDGGCWWVAADLCSECQPSPTREENPIP